MGNKDGGAAFPVVGISHRNGQEIMEVFDNGMTLRDYFAASALAGLINQPDWWTKQKGGLRQFVVQSYEMADEMIAARDK